MSTRACIQVYLEKSNYKENTEGKREFVNTERKPYCLLYRPCDWYPSGLWQDLLEVLKDCDWDRRLLECLGKMEYPPEFTNTRHSDIEYLYKIYAGEMSHRDDKKAINITVKPVHMWDATDEQREELEKPNNEDEIEVEEAIKQDE